MVRRIPPLDPGLVDEPSTDRPARRDRQLTFDAFISYSHAADGQLAPALHGALHQLARPWNRIRALRVYRDKTSLSVTSELWPSIERSLADSRYLILLASPDAAASPWVEKEVRWWLEHRSVDTLMIAVTEGGIRWSEATTDFDWDVTDALPGVLKGRFRHEPLWVDLRFARTANQLSLRHSVFRDAVATLAAPIHGCSKDEIEGEDVRQYRRTRRLVHKIGAAFLALVVALSVLAWVLVRERDHAEHEAAVAVSRSLAARAQTLVDRLPDTALLLSLESIRRASTNESWASLHTTLSRPAYPSRVLVPTQRGIDDVVYSADGRFLAGAGGRGVWLADGATGQTLRDLPTPARAWMPIFSPDARLVAAISDTRAYVWETATGRLVRSAMDVGLTEATPYRGAIAFTGDGRYLASAGVNFSGDQGTTTVRRWDLAGDSAPTTLVVTDFAYEAQFSPDGEWIATRHDRTVGLWHLGPSTHLELARAGAVRFSSDSRTLFIDGALGVDLATGRQTPTAVPADQLYVPNDVSPDGQLVFTNGRIWGLTRTEPAGTALAGLTGQPNDVRFSRDNRMIAGTASEGTVKVWNVATGQPTGPPIATGTGIVVDLEFSPDGQLLTVNGDGTVRVSRLVARQPLGGPIQGRVMTDDQFDATAAIGHDGRVVVVRTDTTAQLWDTVTDEAIGGPLPLGDQVSGHMSADGRQVLIVDEAPTSQARVRLLDTATGQLLREHHISTYDDNGARWIPVVSPDRHHVAVLGQDDVLRLLDVMTGDVDVIAPPTDQGRFWATFSPHGELLLSGNRGGLRVWDIAGRSSVALPESGGYARDIEISPDGAWIAASSTDAIRLWSRTGQLRHTLRWGRDPGNLRFSGDSTRLLAIDEDRTAALWDTATGKRVGTLDEGYLTSSVETSTDGSVLATEFSDAIVLYDLISLKLIATVTPEVGTVVSFALSPDARLLITNSRDGRTRLWDTKRNVEIGSPVEATDAVGFSADGRSFVTTHGDVTQVWRTPDSWVDLACRNLGRNLTWAEWQRYVVPVDRYVRACAAYPAGAGAPADAPVARYPDPYRTE